MVANYVMFGVKVKSDEILFAVVLKWLDITLDVVRRAYRLLRGSRLTNNCQPDLRNDVAQVLFETSIVHSAAPSFDRLAVDRRNPCRTGDTSDKWRTRHPQGKGLERSEKRGIPEDMLAWPCAGRLS